MAGTFQVSGPFPEGLGLPVCNAGGPRALLREWSAKNLPGPSWSPITGLLSWSSASSPAAPAFRTLCLTPQAGPGAPSGFLQAPAFTTEACSFRFLLSGCLPQFMTPLENLSQTCVLVGPKEHRRRVGVDQEL